MNALIDEKILNLSIPERIQLAEDIWDTIPSRPDKIQLSRPQREELDKRLEAYRQDPQTGAQWSVVRDRIRNRA